VKLAAVGIFKFKITVIFKKIKFLNKNVIKMIKMRSNPKTTATTLTSINFSPLSLFFLSSKKKAQGMENLPARIELKTSIVLQINRNSSDNAQHNTLSG
jgi:hypothetical protein